MKIVIAPDSFKGSLTAVEAAKSIQRGIWEVDPAVQTKIMPMADGGEGTLEALLTAAEGEKVFLRCKGPLGDDVDTHYAIVQNHTAVIECANIAGLVQVPPDERNPEVTTSYGIGEVIKNALDKGCSSFVIGLGGSATNDGGLGMLQALGMKGWDKKGKESGIFGKDLYDIDKVSFEHLDGRLQDASFQIACDVDNPLCGKNGATAVYGPQKGATAAQITQLDEALGRFASLVEEQLDTSFQVHPGSGAAGGLGFAFLSLGALLDSGAKLIAGAIGLEKEIADADLVITGEGQSDEQTLYGKAPSYVAQLAKKHHVPTILLSGSLGKGSETLHDLFIGSFAITDRPMNLEDCMAQADELLLSQTRRVIHFFKNMKG
ncbi:glycerate kinase [Radiobacillus kanasensis]|uniref:glycerate kinase n=1 Tax=Radiobacillus kanasensis TaxID=2844358 RepID=UPI001E46D3FD|nr:glycerate kinase [Radiobacillus kanasensis]UFT98665.1 glycerate kinase [Radiobacillus kanasensis]